MSRTLYKVNMLRTKICPEIAHTEVLSRYSVVFATFAEAKDWVRQQIDKKKLEESFEGYVDTISERDLLRCIRDSWWEIGYVSDDKIAYSYRIEVIP